MTLCSAESRNGSAESRYGSAESPYGSAESRFNLASSSFYFDWKLIPRVGWSSPLRPSAHENVCRHVDRQW